MELPDVAAIQSGHNLVEQYSAGHGKTEPAKAPATKIASLGFSKKTSARRSWLSAKPTYLTVCRFG